MSITIKEDRRGEVHTHYRTIEFEGAAPQEHHDYSHRGKLFIPVAASTSWDHGKEPETIGVSGPLLKKDGTPGAITISFRYITPAHPRWGKDRVFDDPKAPAWLLELFDIPVPTPTSEIAQWERENRKSRRRGQRPANSPAPEGILPNTSWPPDPEWGTDEHGRFWYHDYDGESLHIWRDKDGELWIDKKGEGPVYVRQEDVRLIQAAVGIPL